MPAPCRFCVSNTHEPLPDGSNPPCIREFLTPDETLTLLDYDADDIHVFITSRMGLIGADWSVKEIQELLNKALAIEIADPKGMARNMKHGICVWINENQIECRFLKTNEVKLREYEAIYGKEKEYNYG